jgi:Holliday junction resolvase RusA-like endonuclease
MNQNRSTKSIVVSISGEPIALQRHRTLKNGMTYDPQRQLKYQTGIQLKTQVNFRNIDSFLDEDLSLNITFYFEIPASWSKRKKEKVAGKRKGSRPDLTNLIKYYEDVLQDIGVFKDDKQIVEITAKKLYDDGQGPRIEIVLKEEV